MNLPHASVREAQVAPFLVYAFEAEGADCALHVTVPTVECPLADLPSFGERLVGSSAKITAGPSDETPRLRQPLLLAAGDVVDSRAVGPSHGEHYLSERSMARLKPTRDTGGIAAIDSGE